MEYVLQVQFFLIFLPTMIALTIPEHASSNGTDTWSEKKPIGKSQTLQTVLAAKLRPGNFSNLSGDRRFSPSTASSTKYWSQKNPQAFTLTDVLRSQRTLFITDSKKSDMSVTSRNMSCTTSRSITSTGICVNYDSVENLCWDKDAEESTDCIRDKEVCCVERIAQRSIDDSPCGLTGSSIRTPRRLRPVLDQMTKEVCWMAFLSILKNSGNREYICDAVIINSTHVLTPSECVIKLRKDASTTKKVIVTIGKPVNELRQSLDFSQARCGQEYSMDLSSLFISDSMLITLVRKGYALFRVRGQIQQDLCTCRVCLPTEDDFHRLTTSSNCYVSGFLDNGNNLKGKKSSTTLDLLSYRTNLISSAMCQSLLLPQNLSARQVDRIVSKLLCSVTPDISGYCVGGMGGSLTCTGDYDEQHYLIGLSVQPVDCYSAPRLFRNIAGCYDTINESSITCILPNVSLSSGQNQCGRPKTNVTDPFGLAFQTPKGTAQRALNIGRRMQMLSSFPVSDKALLGRSGFAASEISQPGLHLIQEAQLDICWEVAVSNPEKGHCSGVLLTSQHVLTAAHCVTEHDGSTIKNPDIFSVFVGFNSIPREAERECEGIFRVKKIRVHPLYSKPSGSRFYDLNDIAVIELSVPVDLDNNPCACAICLDNIKEPMPGELCTLSGFGCPVPIFATEACPAPRPWSLTWANVVILGEKMCSAIPHYQPEAMTCSVTDGGPSGCYGDSGGPLVCYDQARKRHYLSGIFSFILSTTGSTPQRCRTQPLNPNFYTKATNYIPWLIENVPGLEITL